MKKQLAHAVVSSFCACGLIISISMCSPTTMAQISGATKGEPVIATGSTTGTSKALYLDATQFPDVQTAINNCPSSLGCVIDLRGMTTPITPADPGAKSVTLLFGPGTYLVNQIILRGDLHIYGAGSSDNDGSSGGTPVGTIIKAATSGTSPFKLGAGQMYGIDLEGFRVYGSGGLSGNDPNPAFDITATAGSLGVGGCFYCTFRDITVAGFTGGAGTGVWNFVGAGTAGATPNQFIVMEKVITFRRPGSGYALNVAGANGQMYFTDCEFDGSGGTDNGTNIYIGVRSGTGMTAVPYSLSFRGLTSQSAGLGVRINGAFHLDFRQSHFEALSIGGFNITNPANPGNVPSTGIVIDNSYFAGNVGAPGGYDVNIPTSVVDLVFTHNYITGTPGHVISSTNLAAVTYADNSYNNNTFSNVSPITSGITLQVNPAATINIYRSHVVMLNNSATSVNTIFSQFGPGETVTFISNAGTPGSFQFATGGNINLGSHASPLVVNSPDSVTFINNDLSGTWRLLSKSF